MKKYTYIGVLLMIAGAMANAANTVPYEETFESYAGGFEMPGANGWSAAASSNAVVSTNATTVSDLNAYSEPCGYPVGTASHDKVLEVAGTVTNSIDMAAGQMVWMDIMLQARALESVDAGLLNAAHAAVYFNADKHPMVYHYDSGGSSNRWTEIPETTKSGWARATIGMDYQTGYFQIKMDGNLLTSAQASVNNDGTGGAGGSWFAMPGTPGQLNRLVLDGHGAHMDDLIVTKLDPFKPAIAGVEHFSGDVYKLTVDFPVGNTMVLPSSYSPIRSTDLVLGGWDDTIPHSTNGVAPWSNTNMSYSATVDSSKVIYLQSPEDAAFFGLGE